MNCAICVSKKCYKEEKNCSSTRDRALNEYIGEKKKMHYESSNIEQAFYMKITRVEEVIKFAKSMNYKKIGIAFCIGLSKEAEILHRILSKDFIVYSVCCKTGSIDKSLLDIPKIHSGDNEAMCNPIGQAMELNKSKTDLNLGVGLCVGHDILFTEYSEAPVSILIVKDRVLAHNPVGALYSDYYLEEEKSKK